MEDRWRQRVGEARGREEGGREGGRAKEGKEKQELRVTQTKRDGDGETQTTVRKKERVSFRKQTLKQRCMTCTFSPLDNPEVGAGGGGRGVGG